MAAWKFWKEHLHEIAFESRTTAGKNFDLVIIILIVLSVVIVMLDTITPIHLKYKHIFHTAEWVITILFSLEYLIRVLTVNNPKKFVFSVLGIIDLIAILPTYLTLFLGGTQALLMVRTLRLLRVFRIFRMRNFMIEGRFIYVVLFNSFKKISVFLLFAFILVIILGSIMYLIEMPREGFNSIPEGIYWAIVTMTTTGYGNVLPETAIGKVVASFMMVLGYAIIAVPTGIITTEMALAIQNRKQGHEICKNCSKSGHDLDAAFCKYCGEKF